MKRILFIFILIFSCGNGNNDLTTLVSCFFVNKRTIDITVNCYQKGSDSLITQNMKINDTTLLIEDRFYQSFTPSVLIDSIIVINSNQIDTIDTIYPYPIQETNWEHVTVDASTIEWYYLFK